MSTTVIVSQNRSIQQREADLEVLKQAAQLQPSVALGTYHSTEALQKLDMYFKECFAPMMVVNIEQLAATYEKIKQQRDMLGIHDQITDAKIKTNCVRAYLDTAQRNDYEVELDRQKMAILPMSTRERQQSRIKAAVNQRIQKLISQILTSYLQNAGSVPSDLVASRKDEFDVQLAKMRKEATDGESASPMIEQATLVDDDFASKAEAEYRRRESLPLHNCHFIFSKYNEAVHIAKNTFGEKNSKFKKISSGDLRDEKGIAPILAEHEQGKYVSLANYFKEGYCMDTFSVDYAFDGKRFYDLHPFLNEPEGQQPGYVRELLLHNELLRQSFQYTKPSTATKKFHDQKLSKVFNIRNLYALLDAVTEGPVSSQRITFVSVRGAMLTEMDCDSLARMLMRCPNIVHVDLECVSFPSERGLAAVNDALAHCSGISTLDVSDMRLFLHPLSDTQMASVIATVGTSQDTLIELRAAGSPIMLGYCSDECARIIERVVLPCPNLISIDFSNQRFSSNFVGLVASSIITKGNLLYVDVKGTRGEKTVKETSCGCFHHSRDYLDYPSDQVLNDIRTRCQALRTNYVPERKITVTEDMLNSYLFATHQAEVIMQARVQQTEAELDQMHQAIEDAKYRRELELANASAGKTLVNITNVQPGAKPPAPHTAGSPKFNVSEFAQFDTIADRNSEKAASPLPPDHHTQNHAKNKKQVR